MGDLGCVVLVQVHNLVAIRVIETDAGVTHVDPHACDAGIVASSGGECGRENMHLA